MKRTKLDNHLIFDDILFNDAPTSLPPLEAFENLLEDEISFETEGSVSMLSISQDTFDNSVGLSVTIDETNHLFRYLSELCNESHGGYIEGHIRLPSTSNHLRIEISPQLTRPLKIGDRYFQEHPNFLALIWGRSQPLKQKICEKNRGRVTWKNIDKEACFPIFYDEFKSNGTLTSLRYCHWKMVLEKNGSQLSLIVGANNEPLNVTESLDGNVIKLGNKFLQLSVVKPKFFSKDKKEITIETSIQSRLGPTGDESIDAYVEKLKTSDGKDLLNKVVLRVECFDVNKKSIPVVAHSQFLFHQVDFNSRIRDISQNHFCIDGNHDIIMVTDAKLSNKLRPVFGVTLKSSPHEAITEISYQGNAIFSTLIHLNQFIAPIKIVSKTYRLQVPKQDLTIMDELQKLEEFHSLCVIIINQEETSIASKGPRNVQSHQLIKYMKHESHSCCCTVKTKSR